MPQSPPQEIVLRPKSAKSSTVLLIVEATAETVDSVERTLEAAGHEATVRLPVEESSGPDGTLRDWTIERTTGAGLHAAVSWSQSSADFVDRAGDLAPRLLVTVRDPFGVRSTREALVPSNGDVLSIGRAPEPVDVEIDDQYVSRRHLEVRVDGERLIARDLGSKCGTMRGDEQVPTDRGLLLAHGDILTIGDAVEIRVVDPRAALRDVPPAPPPTDPPTPEPSGSSSGDLDDDGVAVDDAPRHDDSPTPADPSSTDDPALAVESSQQLGDEQTPSHSEQRRETAADDAAPLRSGPKRKMLVVAALSVVLLGVIGGLAYALILGG